mmetsp:Transcript_24088/g.37928  ORF Transcript_24088/g.37928 Transcript_24088/m.37928 type:complete len:93 (+) Transcript_24088:1143-1421(+)
MATQSPRPIWRCCYYFPPSGSLVGVFSGVEGGPAKGNAMFDFEPPSYARPQTIPSVKRTHITPKPPRQFPQKTSAGPLALHESAAFYGSAVL